MIEFPGSLKSGQLAVLPISVKKGCSLDHTCLAQTFPLEQEIPIFFWNPEVLEFKNGSKIITCHKTKESLKGLTKELPVINF